MSASPEKSTSQQKKPPRSGKEKGAREAGKMRRVDKEQMEARVKKREQFMEVNFSYCDFTGFNLNGAKFVRCTFKKASFRKCKLEKADFTLSDLREADFRQSNCKQAIFGNADIKRARFNDADLSEAIFDEAEIDDAIFEGALMRGISYRNVDMNDALLKGAKKLPLEFGNPILYMMSENFLFFMSLGAFLGIALFFYYLYTLIVP